MKTLIKSLRLENAYTTNKTIYFLKSFPLIKNILPVSLYKSTALKVIGFIVSIFRALRITFLGKILSFLSLYVVVFALLQVNPDTTASNFVYAFSLLTIAGGVLNNDVFKPDKSKSYALFCMKMSPKSYTLSTYYYFLAKTFIGNLAVTILAMFLFHLDNILLVLLLALYVAFVKGIFTAIKIMRFKVKQKTGSEKIFTTISTILIPALIFTTYLPIYLGIFPDVIFYPLFGISAVGFIIATVYLHRFTQYYPLYKYIFSKESFMERFDKTDAKDKAAFKATIADDASQTSDKQGFAYFHDLFVKRHKKLLLKPALITAGIIGAIVTGLCIVSVVSNEYNTIIHGFITNHFAGIAFVMYFVNRSMTITKAMFHNCDNAMLSYNFYRRPDVLLPLFRLRLKTLISINLLPSMIMAIGIPLIVYMTGGTDTINYLIMTVSILALSVFFSVHFLLMYYMLQPYNTNAEGKYGPYYIVSWVTYFACYILYSSNVSLVPFSVASLVFCVLYIVLGLNLVQKKAPNTFKLRQ